MNSKKIDKDSKPENKYPCLMALKSSPNCVVLMASEGKGIVVFDGEGRHCHKVGRIGSDWIMSSFEPFAGEIQLSN